MDEQKRGSFAPPAIGGISLLVVFAVLCLTVFALLSLSTVQADARLADSSVRAVQDYYAADCAAQEILARLRNGEMPEGVVYAQDWDSGGGFYSYDCPISDTQTLSVSVQLDVDGSYTILRWQSVYSGEWNEAEGPGLWDGDESALFSGEFFDGMLFD